jgi:carbonic anhydrase
MAEGAGPLDRLENGNKQFKKSVDPLLLAKLAKGQKPFVAILSCSDSPVVPEKVFNLSMGDAFVVRVAGNIASDPAVMGSLEHAVAHLQVRALLVLGHTGCGTISAVMEGIHGNGLAAAVHDINSVMDKLSVTQRKDPDAIAESNVRMQLRTLLDGSEVIRSSANGGNLTVAGAMLDVHSGSVRFL